MAHGPSAGVGPRERLFNIGRVADAFDGADSLCGVQVGVIDALARSVAGHWTTDCAWSTMATQGHLLSGRLMRGPNMLVHAKALRRTIAVLIGITLCGVATPSPAQNLNDILNRLQGMAESENIKRVEAEWNKLPQSERGCVNQKLGDRGDSVQSLARRGILPSDTRVAELRSQCTRAVPPAASQDQPLPQAQPSAPAPSPAPAPAPAPSPAPAAAAEPVPQPAPPPSQTEQPKPDVTLYELQQTNERLKSDLANSATQIAQLEKTKTELERAIKDSERARSDVENEKGVIEETRIADKRKFDASLARLEAEKADAVAKGRTSEFLAYGAFGGLIVVLLIGGAVLLSGWRRSAPPQQVKQG